MVIRPATPADAPAIWHVMEPIVRAGETYALSRDLTETDALAFWMDPTHEVYVAETGAARTSRTAGT
jgi:predicted N-acetyltransferase YhbS